MENIHKLLLGKNWIYSYSVLPQNFLKVQEVGKQPANKALYKALLHLQLIQCAWHREIEFREQTRGVD